jgi:hypothetical protein
VQEADVPPRLCPSVALLLPPLPPVGSILRLSKLLRAHSVQEVSQHGARHRQHLLRRASRHQLDIVEELDKPRAMGERHNIGAAEACQGQQADERLRPVLPILSPCRRLHVSTLPRVGRLRATVASSWRLAGAARTDVEVHKGRGCHGYVCSSRPLARASCLCPLPLARLRLRGATLHRVVMAGRGGSRCCGSLVRRSLVLELAVVALVTLPPVPEHPAHAEGCPCHLRTPFSARHPIVFCPSASCASAASSWQVMRDGGGARRCQSDRGCARPGAGSRHRARPWNPVAPAPTRARPPSQLHMPVTAVCV